MKKKIPWGVLVYTLLILFTFFDFALSVDSDDDFLVCATFAFIGTISIFLFMTDKGFLNIDKVICIFIYIFCYYTPLHQYITRAEIHDFGGFSDDYYLQANLLILLFIFTYFIFKKLIFKKLKIKQIKKESKLILNKKRMVILGIISIICIALLFWQGELFSSSESDSDTSISSIILKFERFLPVSILIMYIFLEKNRLVSSSKKAKKTFVSIIGLIVFIIFFPLNGTISRYLLFGTYLMVIASLFDNPKYKPLIVVVTFLGFYLVFPAFNFFKYNSLSNISEFTLGGFDANYIDYDAYEVFLASLKYVKYTGGLNFANILTALFCFIPRSILSIKLQMSGVIVSNYFGLSFTNISCPLFAEFYLAGGTAGVIVFSAIFALVTRIIESGKDTGNILFSGWNAIAVGMMFVFMRGALLPMTSFWMILSLSYLFVYEICKIKK